MPVNRGRRSRLVATCALVGASTLAGCGGASPSGGGGGGGGGAPSGATLTFQVAIAFTGTDAPFGPETMAGCIPAAKLVNDGGGVLGHQVQCQSTNTQGDPADAVPAVEKMLATTPGYLVGVLGPSSDEASAVMPLLEQAKLPTFPVTGQKEFDKNASPYFWRTLPADDTLGFAMAVWAKQKGYTSAAAVFGNSVGGQAQVPTLQQGFRGLGATLNPVIPIAEGLGSYRSEVQQVVAANPQAIFTELDPQSGATFYSELQQQSTSGLPPIVGDQVILEPAWLSAVGGAVGANTLLNACVAIQPYAPTQGAAYDAFNTALLASTGKVQKPDQYSTDPYAMDPYDSVITMALAMLDAHSTNPATYNAHILNIVQPASGAVEVHTFAEGKAALAAGKHIRYVGAMGPVDFNQYHNSTGSFDAVRCGPNQSTPVGTISAADVAALNK
jgi:branched-chain amino acid transport system substrate-binding protein